MYISWFSLEHQEAAQEMQEENIPTVNPSQNQMAKSFQELFSLAEIA